MKWRLLRELPGIFDKEFDLFEKIPLFLLLQALEHGMHMFVSFFLDACKSSAPLVGYLEDRYPLIRRIRFPDDEPVLFQSFCNAGHVRAGDKHDPADVGNPALPVSGRIKNPQDIVLREGEVMISENDRHDPFEYLGRPHESHQHIFIGALVASIVVHRKPSTSANTTILALRDHYTSLCFSMPVNLTRESKNIDSKCVDFMGLHVIFKDMCGGGSPDRCNPIQKITNCNTLKLKEYATIEKIRNKVRRTFAGAQMTLVVSGNS